METTTQKRRTQLTTLGQRTAKVPNALIYEIMDGRPIYYKGYREVMAGRKTTEEIMGSSTLQWVLASYFMRIMYQTLDETKYWFASNEAGVHLNHRNNLSHDVAVYDRTVLTADKINKKYATVPARVAIEIDVKADLSNEADRNYVNLKTRKLLDFGTDKVIWVFSDSQQIMVAERNADAWLTMDWTRDVELLDGQTFNIGAYLAQEGIDPNQA
jgi:Uma2 family endonuclease